MMSKLAIKSTNARIFGCGVKLREGWKYEETRRFRFFALPT